MYSHIDGLSIPAIANVPFSARMDATWSETLKDGTVVTHRFYNLIGRDASGRIHQEDRHFMSSGPNADSELTTLILKDPIAQTRTTCHMKKKFCEVTTFDPPASKPESAQMPQGQTVDLGWKVIEALEVHGIRETRTYKEGSAGNSKKLSSTKDIWYSPQLQINLSVVRDDAQFGTQELKVSQVKLSDPDSSFFEPPSDFKIVDER